MKELKPLSLDMVKKWGLNTNQLKMQLEIELKKAEKLKQTLRDAEIELRKIKERQTAFTEVSIQTYRNILEDKGVAQSNNALMAALVNLRRENIRLQENIKETQAQTKKLQEKLAKAQGASAHDKYARVMENLTGQQADIRATWDSNDVLKIDDVAIERNVSYDEAKDIVEGILQEGEVETEDI